MNIIFFGSPGVGKGTYAEIFTEKLNIPHISTGDIFRENIKNQTELGKKAKALMDDGKLVPDDITNEIVKDRVQQDDCASGFILDGYPRTVDQANALDAHTKVDKVLYFVAPDEVILRRLGGRITCPKCQRIFHIKNVPPKVEGKCDDDNIDLIVRADQTEEAIKVRLDIYRKETAPVLDYYKEKDLVIEVDSSRDISEARDAIVESIQKALDQ